MNWLSLGVSFGARHLTLKYDIPTVRRFTFSRTERTSKNFNLSLGSTTSELYFGWLKYFNSPRVDQTWPPQFWFLLLDLQPCHFTVILSVLKETGQHLNKGWPNNIFMKDSTSSLGYCLGKALLQSIKFATTGNVFFFRELLSNDVWFLWTIF